MKKKNFILKNKYRIVIDKLGWSISDIDDFGQVELSKKSPYGEDFSIIISVDNFENKIANYEFDPEDHVEEMIMAKQQGFKGVPSVFTLCEDAKGIEAMIEDLQEKIDLVK